MRVFFRGNHHKWPMLFFNRFYWHNQELVGRPNSIRFRRVQDCPISHLPTFFRAPIRSNSQQLSHQLAALEASSFFWGYCEWVIACLWCFSKDDGDGGIRPNHVHVCIYVSHFNFVSLCECIYIFIYIYVYARVCVCVCAVNFNLFMLPLELRECHLFRRSVKVRTRMPDRRGGNLSFGLFHVAREWSTEGQIWYDMMWHLNSPVVLSWLLVRSRWNHVESRGFCYCIFCFLFSVISGILSLRIEWHLPVHCCFLQVHLGFFSGSCHGIGLGLAEWRSTCHPVAHQSFQCCLWVCCCCNLCVILSMQHKS